MIKRTLLLGTLVLAVWLLAPTCVIAKTHESAAQVLEDSHEASRNLPNQERAFYLVRLIDISTSISPEKTEGWSKELSELARNLPHDWNRVAIKKNALVPLSRINPIKAFEQLGLVEKPIPGPDGFSEDVRADAAATIYPNYFAAVGVGGLDKIVAQAQGFAQNGEFPYRAIGLILERSSSSHIPAEKSARIFRLAVAQFSRGSDYLDENSQFFELLQSSRNVIPDNVYSHGLRELVARLTSPTSKETPNFSSVVRTADGEYPFVSEKMMLLFRIYPMVARLDRPLAVELVQKYPLLVHSDPEVREVTSSAVLGNVDTREAQRLTDKMQQQALAAKIGHLQQSDPRAGLAEAQLMSDETAKARALSSLVPGLQRVDPEQAVSVYEQLRDLAATLPEGPVHVHAMVQTAKAACYLRDVNECADLVGQALDSGVQILTAKSDKLIIHRPGHSELQELTEFAAERDDSIVKTIRDIPNDGIRAYLLLYAANGLGKAENASKSLANK
jgi:hypothetical protein